ncbi:hypothetical protein SUNI508_03214 [Seiridium unicorne]|uniref:Uncharacterized protein n=1 Tax=Seiridium unicorne TaxID=138068 RepID=A0ABR2VDT5_9PEZI
MQAAGDLVSRSGVHEATNGPLICSSMRKRSDWASLFPALLQSTNPTGRWKEAQLETHDVAMPLPLPGQPSHLAFRAICLSSQDIGSLETRKRIERLYNVNGGQYIAVVFLMKQHNEESGPAMMMKLQKELLGGWEMPIIPILETGTFPSTIKAFHHQLMTSAAPDKPPDPVRSLLPHCSDIGNLPEHTVNVLSDITKDFKEVISNATTPEGQRHLRDYLGNDAERLIKFWQAEYLVE